MSKSYEPGTIPREDQPARIMDIARKHLGDYWPDGIGTPELFDIRVEASGLAIADDSLVPARLPTLFSGSPLRIMGRYRDGSDASTITIWPTGRLAGTATHAVASGTQALPFAGSLWSA